MGNGWLDLFWALPQSWTRPFPIFSSTSAPFSQIWNQISATMARILQHLRAVHKMKDFAHCGWIGHVMLHPSTSSPKYSTGVCKIFVFLRKSPIFSYVIIYIPPSCPWLIYYKFIGLNITTGTHLNTRSVHYKWSLLLTWPNIDMWYSLVSWTIKI